MIIRGVRRGVGVVLVTGVSFAACVSDEEPSSPQLSLDAAVPLDARRSETSSPDSDVPTADAAVDAAKNDASDPTDAATSEAGDASTQDGSIADASVTDGGVNDASTNDATTNDGGDATDGAAADASASDGSVIVDGGMTDGALVPDAAVDAAPVSVSLFTSQSAWAAAAACGTTRAFYFDGATELSGRTAIDPNISPSYASLGVNFQPFLGTTVYPQILRGQQGQIALAGHDGLLINNVSPNPTSNLLGRAIRATFVTPVSAFGVHTNVGDGGEVKAYGAADELLGTASISSGGFGGIVSSSPIARVEIINTFNADINFGIYGFQFCAP